MDVSLKEYIEGLIAAMEKQHTSHWEAHGREHALLKEAVDAAHLALIAKLEVMNEMRTQILSERGEFLKTSEYHIEHNQLEKRTTELEKARANLDGRFWMLGTGLMGITVLLNLILRWLVK